MKYSISFLFIISTFLFVSCSKSPDLDVISKSISEMIKNENVKVSIDDLTFIKEYKYERAFMKIGKCYLYNGKVSGFAITDLKRVANTLNAESVSLASFQKMLDDKKKYFTNHRDCSGKMLCESETGPRNQEEIDTDYKKFESMLKNKYPFEARKGDIVGKDVQFEVSACKNEVSKSEKLEFPSGIKWK